MLSQLIVLIVSCALVIARRRRQKLLLFPAPTNQDVLDWSFPRTAWSKFKFPFKVHCVLYGDAIFEKSMYRLWLQAHDTHWFDSIFAYRKTHLSKQFQEEFSHILSMRRGGGYWIWKADILLQELDKCKPNDIIVYIDSGCTINPAAENRFVEYLQMLSKSSHSDLSFQLEYIEHCYTVQQLFHYFGVQHKKDITDSGQLLATVMFFKANETTRSLLQQFVQVLRDDPKLVTDEYHSVNQIESFIENRHDQSILSLLRKTRGSLVIPEEIEKIPSKSQDSHLYPFWATRLR